MFAYSEGNTAYHRLPASHNSCENWERNLSQGKSWQEKRKYRTLVLRDRSSYEMIVYLWLCKWKPHLWMEREREADPVLPRSNIPFVENVPRRIIFVIAFLHWRGPIHPPLCPVIPISRSLTRNRRDGRPQCFFRLQRGYPALPCSGSM